MKKRIATSLLLVAMLASASCGSKTTTDTPVLSDSTTTAPSDSTTAAVETIDPLMDDLGEFDFENYEYRVLSVTYDPNSYFTLFDSEENGEVLNDALVRRNLEIEERFNVQFVASEDSYGNNYTTLQKSVRSNEHAYDMIQLINRNAFAAAIDGQLMPISELTYLDPNKDYYLHDVNEQLSIAGKQVLLYSEECLHAFQSSVVLLFNKEIAKDHNLGNYYDMVRDGTWTLDRYFSDSRLVCTDVNGDSMWDDSDLYGTAVCVDAYFPSIYNGTGELSIRKDEDGIPYFAAISSEKMTEVVERIIHELDSSKHLYYTESQSFAAPVTAFAQNISLFTAAPIGRMTPLREMESDYGLLPFPKYDESQEQYYSRMVDGWLHVVPITNPDPERTSVILEALASGSARYILPAYYDTIFNNKILRDEESIEMMEIVRKTRIIDLGELPWYETVRLRYTTDLFYKRKGEFASLNAKIATRIEKEINKTLDALDSIG